MVKLRSILFAKTPGCYEITVTTSCPFMLFAKINVTVKKEKLRKPVIKTEVSCVSSVSEECKRFDLLLASPSFHSISAKSDVT